MVRMDACGRIVLERLNYHGICSRTTSKGHRRLASKHDPFPLSSGGVVWSGRGLAIALQRGGKLVRAAAVHGRQGGCQVLPLQGLQAVEGQQGSAGAV
jgi:hypothetical protein